MSTNWFCPLDGSLHGDGTTDNTQFVSGADSVYRKLKRLVRSKDDPETGSFRVEGSVRSYSNDATYVTQVQCLPVVPSRWLLEEMMCRRLPQTKKIKREETPEDDAEGEGSPCRILTMASSGCHHVLGLLKALASPDSKKLKRERHPRPSGEEVNPSHEPAGDSPLLFGKAQLGGFEGGLGKDEKGERVQGQQLLKAESEAGLHDDREPVEKDERPAPESEPESDTDSVQIIVIPPSDHPKSKTENPKVSLHPSDARSRDRMSTKPKKEGPAEPTEEHSADPRLKSTGANPSDPIIPPPDAQQSDPPVQQPLPPASTAGRARLQPPKRRKLPQWGAGAGPSVSDGKKKNDGQAEKGEKCVSISACEDDTEMEQAEGQGGVKRGLKRPGDTKKSREGKKVKGQKETKQSQQQSQKGRRKDVFLLSSEDDDAPSPLGARRRRLSDEIQNSEQEEEETCKGEEVILRPSSQTQVAVPRLARRSGRPTGSQQDPSLSTDPPTVAGPPLSGACRKRGVGAMSEEGGGRNASRQVDRREGGGKGKRQEGGRETSDEPLVRTVRGRQPEIVDIEDDSDEEAEGGGGKTTKPVRGDKPRTPLPPLAPRSPNSRSSASGAVPGISNLGALQVPPNGLSRQSQRPSAIGTLHSAAGERQSQTDKAEASRSGARLLPPPVSSAHPPCSSQSRVSGRSRSKRPFDPATDDLAALFDSSESEDENAHEPGGPEAGPLSRPGDLYSASLAGEQGISKGPSAAGRESLKSRPSLVKKPGGGSSSSSFSASAAASSSEAVSPSRKDRGEEKGGRPTQEADLPGPRQKEMEVQQTYKQERGKKPLSLAERLARLRGQAGIQKEKPTGTPP
uniref:Uncharacterized protein n=1 Tax=Chromera velia CCMP2878 TaxID=1169474 RepID=A0A0G4FID7_9ALVE|eukprot:Cvel_17138.t1-p1 / transcript=Cvel_17138.t1 / gene=Cvel_17138 / organism=Chromera_velia_CCMP2878 / gene_product=hypothetical protein / transcript_product=hypothetical protein / location=Cvel_scaffold1353:5365-8611(-) / protein_length=852 / sequence_SO=supercontig / SO=protein_coding / is_pseudo=false